MPRSMLRSLLAAGLAAAATALGACAETSKAPSVTAPSASDTGSVPSPAVSQPASATPPAASAAPTAPPTVSVSTAVAAVPSASAGAPPASSTGPGAAATNVPAQYRACRSDGDCVAVPRAGCCANGWKEAVAVSHKDAYARDLACTTRPRPMCPMYIVNDARVAKCEPQSHLCVMVQP